MRKYFKRKIETKISELFKVFPIVSITGPRQSGKSTLIKHYISNSKEKWRYMSLDDREILLGLKSDPSLFTKSIDSNIAIDEAQRAPELFNYLKLLVDSGFRYNKIILSGSANFLLLKNISESLAGRVGILELLPFSFAEAHSLKSNNVIEEIISHRNIESLFAILSKKKLANKKKLLLFILRGGYPKLYQDPKINRDTLLRSYISTYIERDLRDLSQIASIENFQRVYKLLAYQSGSIINTNSLAGDIEIDAKTVSKYISILESSYCCKYLNPYFSSTKKRLIKRPKIFFLDTGLLNYFNGNEDLNFMLNRPTWGNILETFVYSEIYKEIKDLNQSISLYFFRTSNGAELDFVLEKAQNLYPIEVKSSIRIDSRDLRGIKSFNEIYGKRVPFSIVFYRGEEVKYLEKNVLAVPLQIL